MDIKAKVTILSLVFILSTVFFWLAINEYLLPSKAQLGSNMQIIPHTETIDCNPSGECYVHILGSVDETNAVAGVTGHVQFGQGLQPQGITKQGVCASSSLGLDTELGFDVDETKNIATFSLGALKSNDKLKGGTGCITSIVFTAKQPGDQDTNAFTTSLSLTQQNMWKAGGLIDGQPDSFVPQLDSTQVVVNVDPNAPEPTDGPLPTVTGPTSPTGPAPTGPKGCDISKADCNCDGAVDLIDWEILRSHINNEGGSCDINGDGTANAIDASVWISNNELLDPVIFE